MGLFRVQGAGFVPLGAPALHGALVQGGRNAWRETQIGSEEKRRYWERVRSGKLASDLDFQEGDIYVSFSASVKQNRRLGHVADALFHVDGSFPAREAR